MLLKKVSTDWGGFHYHLSSIVVSKVVRILKVLTRFSSVILGVVFASGIYNTLFIQPAGAALLTGLIYVPASSPFRICDTRSNNQTPCQGQTLAPNSVITIQVTGVTVQGESVPTTAQAVVISLTATNTTAPGYFSVYPASGSRPQVSSLNWSKPYQTVANLVQVGLSNGAIDVYLGSKGSSDLIVDVQGWYVPETSQGLYYNPVSPFRVCDTRQGTSTQCSGQSLSPGTSFNFKVAGLGNVPSNAQAVVLNVTIINPTSSGYVTLYPTGSPLPLVSNQNFSQGLTIAVRVFATLSTTNPGYESIYIFGAYANVAVDVDGYFLSGSGDAFYLSSSQRIIDTRCYYVFDDNACQGENLPASNLYAALTSSNVSQSVIVAGLDNIPSWASAVAINATAISYSLNGYLTLYPPSSSIPIASDLNFQVPGQVAANAAVVGISSFSETVNGQSINGIGFDFVSSRQMQFIADVIGFYGPTNATTQLYVAPLVPPLMIPNTSYAINLEASDLPGSLLSWSITQSGSNFSLCSSNSSLCQLTGQEPAGSYNITITVTDGTTSQSLSLTLTSESPVFSSPKTIATAPVVMVSVSCVGTSFCVDGGALTSTYNGSSWSYPVSVDPQAGFNSVSCVSTTFCMAVDTSGQALSYNGSSWSKPTVIDSNPGYYGLMGVSCVSTTFCMAVDDNGQAVAYLGTWGSPGMIDPTGNNLGNALVSISCSSQSFCATIDQSGNVIIFNGVHWSYPHYLHSGIGAVSCPAYGYCVIVGSNGQLYYYNNGNYSQGPLIDQGGYLTEVSCSSSSFCMAIDLGGHAVVFANGTWSNPITLTTDKYGLRGLSCTQSDFCVAVGHTIVTYQNGSVSAPYVIPGSQNTFVWVSCPEIYWCMAASTSGEVINLIGAQWSLAQDIETGINGFLAISCSSPQFCLAVDNAGYGFIYDGGGWYEVGIEPGVSLVAASCPADYFCVVSDSIGNVIIFSNGSLLSKQHVDTTGTYVSSVSCVSTSFCMAVDDAGNALSFSNGSWTSPIKIDLSPGSAGLTSVSCASVNFCVAVDFSGHEITFTGSWGQPVAIAPSFVGFASVSCPVAGNCWASDWIGSVIQDANGTWQSLTDIDSSYGVTSISCPVVSYCVASSDNSSVMITNGPL